jgi:hypothetical protein
MYAQYKTCTVQSNQAVVTTHEVHQSHDQQKQQQKQKQKQNKNTKHPKRIN